MHKVDERVAVADLADLTAIYRTVARALLSARPSAMVTPARSVVRALRRVAARAGATAAAMAWFDRSLEGVSRSFWAAVICYPGFVVLLLLRFEPGSASRRRGLSASCWSRRSATSSAGAPFRWRCCRLPAGSAREERALGFIVAYNWCAGAADRAAAADRRGAARSASCRTTPSPMPRPSPISRISSTSGSSPGSRSNRAALPATALVTARCRAGRDAERSVDARRCRWSGADRRTSTR